MANPLISGLGAFASVFLDEDDAQALQDTIGESADDTGEFSADDINAEDQSATPNLEPLNAVTNIASPSQTSTPANQPTNPPSNQPAFAPAQPIQSIKMPKPAFSSNPSPAPSHESTPAPKAKMLNFGDALAQGLPQSWSIVPPTANVVQRPAIPTHMPSQIPKRNF